LSDAHDMRRSMNVAKVMYMAICLTAVWSIADIGLALRGYDSFSLRAWFRTSSFSRIHGGMTARQVRARVGPPRAIEPNLHYSTWYYDSSRHAPKGTVSRTPRTGQPLIVFFAATGRVSRVVTPTLAGTPSLPVAPGMSEKEVYASMGKPDSARTLPYAECWRYFHRNRTEHCIQFDKRRRVVRVIEWFTALSRPGTYRAISRERG